MPAYPKPEKVKKTKKKQPSARLLKQKAWAAFSLYIRTRDCIKTTGTLDEGICITCRKRIPFKESQAGHFVGGRSGSVLFDEQIVHLQCARCNIWLKGNYSRYTLAMIDLYGRFEVERMLALKNTIVQFKPSDYEEIRNKYINKKNLLLTQYNSKPSY